MGNERGRPRNRSKSREASQPADSENGGKPRQSSRSRSRTRILDPSNLDKTGKRLILMDTVEEASEEVAQQDDSFEEAAQEQQTQDTQVEPNVRGRKPRSINFVRAAL